MDAPRIAVVNLHLCGHSLLVDEDGETYRADICLIGAEVGDTNN